MHVSLASTPVGFSFFVCTKAACFEQWSLFKSNKATCEEAALLCHTVMEAAEALPFCSASALTFPAVKHLKKLKKSSLHRFHLLTLSLPRLFKPITGD